MRATRAGKQRGKKRHKADRRGETGDRILKRNTRSQIGDGSDGEKKGCKSVTGLTRDST